MDLTLTTTTWNDITHFYPINWTVTDTETNATYPCLVVQGFEDGTYQIDGDPVRMAINAPNWFVVLETLSLGIRDLSGKLLLRYMDLNGTAIWVGELHELDNPLILQFEALLEQARSNLQVK